MARNCRLVLLDTSSIIIAYTPPAQHYTTHHITYAIRVRRVTLQHKIVPTLYLASNSVSLSVACLSGVAIGSWPSCSELLPVTQDRILKHQTTAQMYLTQHRIERIQYTRHKLVLTQYYSKPVPASDSLCESEVYEYRGGHDLRSDVVLKPFDECSR